MKKLGLTALAALAAMFALVFAGGAAQAYPDNTLTIHVSATTVTSGHSFTFSASAPASCSWTASFNGDTKHGSGKSFSGSFTTPSVTKKTVINLTITCDTGNARVSGHAGNALAIHTAVTTRSIPITVVPKGGNNSSNGGLPNTGGPSMMILLGGLVLVVAGGGAIAYGRKRTNATA